jgi:hypothetical protein
VRRWNRSQGFNALPALALSCAVCSAVSKECASGDLQDPRFGIVGLARLLCSVRMQEQRCAECRRITPGYDIINSGSAERGYRQLCSRCFNEEMAMLDGLDEFTHVSV